MRKFHAFAEVESGGIAAMKGSIAMKPKDCKTENILRKYDIVSRKNFEVSFQRHGEFANILALRDKVKEGIQESYKTP